MQVIKSAKLSVSSDLLHYASCSGLGTSLTETVRTSTQITVQRPCPECEDDTLAYLCVVAGFSATFGKELADANPRGAAAGFYRLVYTRTYLKYLLKYYDDVEVSVRAAEEKYQDVYRILKEAAIEFYTPQQIKAFKLNKEDPYVLFIEPTATMLPTPYYEYQRAEVGAEYARGLIIEKNGYAVFSAPESVASRIFNVHAINTCAAVGEQSGDYWETVIALSCDGLAIKDAVQTAKAIMR